MRNRRSQELLHVPLPPAAHEAAVAMPPLRDALSVSPGLSFDIAARIYNRKTPVGVAQNLMRHMNDPRIVDHALSNGERRHAVIETMLSRFGLTAAQQLKLVSRSLTPSTAEAFIRYRYATNEASLSASRHCDAEARLDWLACASWVLDEEVTASLSDYRSFKNFDDCARQTRITHLRRIFSRRPAVLEWATASEDPDMMWAASAVGLPDGAHARFVARVCGLAQPKHHLTALANVLEHPETPHEVRQDLWAWLKQHEPDKMREMGLSSPKSLPFSPSLAQETDAEILDRMCFTKPIGQRDNNTEIHQILTLGTNPNLSDDQVSAVIHRLNNLSWSDTQWFAPEVFAIVERWDVDPRSMRAPYIRRGLGQEKHTPAPAETICEHASSGQSNSGRWSAQPDKQVDIRDVPVAPTGYSSGFAGRSREAVAAFEASCGDNVTAWSVLFSLVDSFQGTVGELADTVAATVS